MTPNLLLDIRTARAAVADPDNWCRGDAARSRRGSGPMCAAMAVRAAVPTSLPAHQRMERVEAALEIMNQGARHFHDRSLVGLNDHGPEGSGRETTDASDAECYDAVMLLFDRVELALVRRERTHGR